MLVERLKSALPLLLVVCIAFFAPLNVSAWLFAILACGMLVAACTETFNLLAPTFKRRHFSLALLLGIILMLPTVVGYLANLNGCDTGLKWAAFLDGAMPAVMGAGILIAFAYTFHSVPDRQNVNGILAAIGAFVFVVWQVTYLVKIFYYPVAVAEGNPRILLFYLILVTKMADVGAFTVGVTAAKRPGGNHTLAPLISPKKSWEGLLGGTLFSLISSLVFTACCFSNLRINGIQIVGWVDAVIIGILASPVGLLGDLAESALKRSANAKDSGKIPGIGGILDTLDSLLPMGPIFYAYIAMKIALAA